MLTLTTLTFTSYFTNIFACILIFGEGGKLADLEKYPLLWLSKAEKP